jgi:hypothetical protein
MKLFQHELLYCNNSNLYTENGTMTANRTSKISIPFSHINTDGSRITNFCRVGEIAVIVRSSIGELVHVVGFPWENKCQTIIRIQSGYRRIGIRTRTSPCKDNCIRCIIRYSDNGGSRYGNSCESCEKNILECIHLYTIFLVFKIKIFLISNCSTFFCHPCIE